MSLVPFLVVAFALGSLSLLLRRRVEVAAAIGVAGLLAGLVAASTIRAGDPLSVGGVSLVGSDYVRLYAMLGCATGLLLLVVAASTTWSRSLPGAMLCGLGAAAVAIASSDAETAVAAASAGAVAGVLVAMPGSSPDRGLMVAGRELRALVVAAILGLVAIAVVAARTSDGGPAPDPGVTGLAYLAVAAAAAIRLGAIPFHLRAARVADVAPEVALPLVMAWGPAAFALVVLGWADATLAPLGGDWPVERGVVLATASVSILFGTAAAMIHDDLEHVVAYSIVADAGIALLALVALDPAAWGAARTWLLAFVVIRTAFAAWAAALRGSFGSGRVSELSGWARRAPVLGVALLAVALAGVGWPGTAAFASRAALVNGAADGPIVVLLLAGGLATAAVYARLLVAGVRRPGVSVRTATPGRVVGLRPRERTGRARDDAITLWRRNRAPLAGVAVLLLAGLAVAVAGGGLGMREAAAGDSPIVVGR